MALDVLIGGANLDASGNLKATLPAALAQAGFALSAFQKDAGAVTGTPYNAAPIVSEDGRLSVGLATIAYHDTFNYTAQNTAMTSLVATTQTAAFGSGFVTLNASAITTINTNIALQTRRWFQINGDSSSTMSLHGFFTQAPQANDQWVFGACISSGATATPTDGVYFKLTTTGLLIGVLNYNGVETVTSAFAFPTVNAVHDFSVVVDASHAEFWIDDVLQADIDTQIGNGQPLMSGSFPITVHHLIGGSAPGVAQQFKIATITVTYEDVQGGKPWSHVMAADGLMASQGQDGGTMGSTALFTNSLAAGAGAAMTNTAASLGSGLGGQFAALPTLAAGTDGIVCSYQVPAPTVNLTGRTLMLTGIKIHGAVTTVLAGGPVLYAYSLAYGHTAVSMATAEAATTKAPRRIPLGYETFAANAAVGTLGSPGGVYMAFNSPIAVNPGEFVAVCAKNLGVVTTTGVITFQVTPDGYFE